ncbi:MAG: AAA family ATPase [Gammaproteobacteria bacterium]|nr:AAA family ATPase [Gammaproteobacteria bacterium]
MYQGHFGLRELPFSLTPDTAYFYRNPEHQEALNVLLLALKMGEGFLKITGEVGTGKTLLCRTLLNHFEGKSVVTAYIPNPTLSPMGLYAALTEELGIPFSSKLGRHHNLKVIYKALINHKRQGRQVVLLIDESQALPDESLEAIRLLTNLETEKSKLLQVVLFGQPELDRRLDQNSIRQLKQRITFSYTLKPLNVGSIGGYLLHRLSIAGYEGDAFFTASAIRRLYRGSQGIPRLVNIIAHKSLLAAYGAGKREVSRNHVNRAIKDTEGARQSGWMHVFIPNRWLAVSLSGGAGMVLLMLFGGQV